MKGRVLVVLLALAFLALAACQRSANPPVYETEIVVILGEGDWNTPLRVHVAIGGGDSFTYDTKVLDQRPPSREHSFSEWLEAGTYSVQAWASEPAGSNLERELAESRFFTVRVPSQAGPLEITLRKGVFLKR